MTTPTFRLRDYQQIAADRAVDFFADRRARYNALIVLPTGAGKSLVIADIARRLAGNTLVFQPSKEILQQNYAKLQGYGVTDCAVFSASLGRKDISRITFATIGSAIGRIDNFRRFDNIIIDECHLVNARHGMYETFINALGRKVLGLTATPYRLASSRLGSMLRFLTRTRPRIFAKVIYQVQISTLLDMGYLAPLDYYSCPPPMWDERRLVDNSTGADWTDRSVQEEYRRTDFHEWLVQITRRVLAPKSGQPRNGVLVFTRFLEEAQRLTEAIPAAAMVSGDTPPKEREAILRDFKDGRTPLVVNVGVLTTGFDHPALDTVIMARPTKSLALWYQCVGRAIRPYPGKRGWIIDLCGNMKRFGRVQDLRLEEPKPNMWRVMNGDRQLTNILY